jgi:NADH-quinone oxidoreductase subunit L
LLSGFFSKDEILLYALVSPRGAALLFIVMAFTALLTAFYMFRLLWLTFFGASRVSHEVEHHIHESPWTMTGVLVILAFLSIVGGWISIPHFLEAQLPLPKVGEAAHHYHWTVVGISVALGLLGLAGAWFIYGRGRANRAEALRQASGPLYKLSLGKYYVDEIYNAVINKPLLWLSEAVFLRLGDRALIDGTLNGLAALAQRVAGRLGRLQTGNMQMYVLLVMLGIVGALLWSWRYV